MEIFLFDPATRAFTQITDSTEPFFNFEPSLSASGNRIAFTSTADLTGNNGDHSREIFLFDTSSNSLIQITNDDQVSSGLGGSRSPSISAGGSRIAFSSDTDPTGANIDHNSEIFLINPENDAVYLPLKKGRNELMLAVSELGGGWGFICRLADPEN